MASFGEAEIKEHIVNICQAVILVQWLTWGDYKPLANSEKPYMTQLTHGLNSFAVKR